MPRVSQSTLSPIRHCLLAVQLHAVIRFSVGFCCCPLSSPLFHLRQASANQQYYPFVSQRLGMSSSNSPDSTNLPKVDFSKTETVGATRWMRLETLSYQVPLDESESAPNKTNGSSLRKWDRVVRTTKKSEDSIDAVVILAILKHDPKDPRKDEVVCVKQFRPPIDAFCIELPAGLIDPDEDPGQAAEREFTEETGYVGKVVDVSPPSFLSPGLTNESACMVRLEVDMTLAQNIQNHSKQLDRKGLEECEKDRGLEKLLLPRIGLLDALHALQKKDGVKVFAAFYSMALGMSVGEDVIIDEPSNNQNFPLIELKLMWKNGELQPTNATAHAVTEALRKSGFLLLKTALLPFELQQRALNGASHILQKPNSSSMVVTHPSDPKVYAMLHGCHFISDASVDPSATRDVKEWYQAARATKDLLLYCIAVGLGLSDDPKFLSNLHSENNDSLRLIQYLPKDEQTGNRCKEHSDYGTLTLLLTDGVAGLEAYVDEQWTPIPYIEGAVVVNIGSILSQWTRQELKATLHRVAGPTSKNSTTPKDDLLSAVSVPRTSMAYFADPNGDISSILEGDVAKNPKIENGMSVAEYIKWRSGGVGAEREGIAFTSAEKKRLQGDSGVGWSLPVCGL